LSIGKTSLILILAVMVIYITIILYSDLEEFSKNFLEINYEYLPVILSLVFFGLVTKSFRQLILLRSIGIDISMKENFIIYFSGLSMQATPGGLGTMIKSQFIKKNYGHSLLKTMPVVLVERFHDLLSMITIITILSFFYQLIEIQIILAILIPILIISYLSVRQEKILVFFVNRLLNIKFLSKFIQNLVESQETLRALSSYKIMLSCWGISLFGLTLEAISIYYSFIAFNLDFGIIETTLITFTSMVIGAVSFIPGGIGLTEASLIGFLVLSKVELATASSLAIFIRLTTIWFATIVGFIATRIMFSRKTNINI